MWIISVTQFGIWAMSENQGRAFNTQGSRVVWKWPYHRVSFLCQCSKDCNTQIGTGSLSRQNGSASGLAASGGPSWNYLSFLAETSSLTEVFMDHGNLSWPTLMWSARSDEFVALWPPLYAGRAWGQRPEVRGYPVQQHMPAGKWGAAVFSLGPSLHPSHYGLATAQGAACHVRSILKLYMHLFLPTSYVIYLAWWQHCKLK